MRNLSKEEIKERQKYTCWESLSYCCGLEKNCPSRNKAMKSIGLTKEEYLQLKEKFDENLFNLIENKFKCEVCKRKTSGMRYMIFIPFDDMIYLIPMGKHYTCCLECNLSYSAQWLNMNEKEINDLIKFYSEVFDDLG